MITQDEFVNLIIDYKMVDKRIDLLSEVVCRDIFENEIIQGYWKLFETHIHSHFDELGCDMIMWYLLEKDEVYSDRPPEDVEIDTVDDLWNYVKEHFK